MTQERPRTNLFQEPFLLDLPPTPSRGSSETKTERIDEIRPNPESSDVQLQNKPANAKNEQKTDENEPH